MRLRAFSAIGLLAVAALAAVAWIKPRAPAPETGKLNVVATTSIIADWVHNVGGDDVDVTTLVGPDGDPHEFQPAPSDAIAVSQAKLIFENGLGLETWLDKLYGAADATGHRIVVNNGIVIRHAPGEASGTPGSADEIDPHAWQNVADAIIAVRNIRDALVQADPVHADAYATRADAYTQQLETLDTWISAEMRTIPQARRKLVTTHDAFGYFGDRYGLDISRSALESFSTEAADPSAKQVAGMVDQIKSAGVPVIFLENIENPRLMNQIADEARVKVGPALYTDALGAPGSAGDTYLKMMRYNVEAIVNALR